MVRALKIKLISATEALEIILRGFFAIQSVKRGS